MGERNQRFQRAQHVAVDAHRSGVVLTIVHHPVPDRAYAVPFNVRRHGFEQEGHGLVMTECCVLRPVFHLQLLADAILDDVARRRAQPLDAAGKHTSQLGSVFLEHRKLDAREPALITAMAFRMACVLAVE